MTKRDDGGPAFPDPSLADPSFLPDKGSYGMTLRDWFAGLAMQSEMESTFSDATPEAARAFAEAAIQNGHGVEQHLAFNAYKIADAMLEARKR